MSTSEMTDHAADPWAAMLTDLGEEKGYFHNLGQDHSVLFAEEGTKLLVSFETVENCKKNTKSGLPRGVDLLPEWSHLVILSSGQTWFRDPAVFAFFDRLIDEGFLEDFDEVVFMGSGSAGYAAAAFSVAAPGAHVLAFEPQATLDPRITGWDDRFCRDRRRGFTDRYGFAPDMIEAASQVTVFFDPASEEDAMHAALFRRPNSRLTHVRHLMGYIESIFADMNILGEMIELAGSGQLSDVTLAKLLRNRRENLNYLRNLMTAVDAPGREASTRRICAHALARFDAPRFNNRLKALKAVPAVDAKSEMKVLEVA